MANKKTLLIDGHVHVYQHFDLVAAFEGAARNLRQSAKNSGTEFEESKTVPILMLSERHDCNFFKQAHDALLQQPINGFTFHRTDESESLLVKRDNEPYLYIIAGRQIVTLEGLEVISVLTTLYIKDRSMTTQEVVRKVHESGGFPIINWAPGKWFFERGKVVNNLIETVDPSAMLVGDTTLRTTMWRLPSLMKKAVEQGFKIVAGSDPLPFKNEERHIGTYGFAVLAEFDEARPAQSIRSMLRNEKTEVQLIGSRNGLFTFLKRQTKIMIL
ncbi:hypothetical protein JXB12_04990 [candidate division KSB1 bacterium]|nr:hypothetical protein [candidate division KSB1 bacterium]